MNDDNVVDLVEAMPDGAPETVRHFEWSMLKIECFQTQSRFSVVAQVLVRCMDDGTLRRWPVLRHWLEEAKDLLEEMDRQNAELVRLARQEAKDLNEEQAP